MVDFSTVVPSVIYGTINRFLYQNNDNGYVVFILDCDNSKSVTVKGTLPSIQVGQHVELSGAWVMDPKYGSQFAATVCRGSMPTSLIGLEKFLGSGLIKGIGPKYAQKLVAAFGLNVLDVIEKNPEKLSCISGLGPKRIDTMTTAWKEHKEIADVMVFLQDKGISSNLAVRLYKRYKHNTIPYILQNPYRLAEEVWGIGFKTADEIALKLGFTLDCSQRIAAGILFSLATANQQGHLYLEASELKSTVYNLLVLEVNEINAEKIKREMHALFQQDKIKFISKSQHHYFTTTKCYKAEMGVSQCIKKLLSYPSQLNINIDELYALLHRQKNTGIELNENQIKGILAAMQNKVTIITGGPGTGKTTLVRNLINALESYKLRYKLAAPTGRAAKRMNESTGRFAATVHRLLDFDPLVGSFKHNENNAIQLDFLVVDEASMIDIFLAHSILKALPLHAHVLFIGDVDQLPAVGAGNFLNDCITSNIVTAVRLTEVFRQAQDSLIIVNAHRTNRGEFPVSFIPGSKRDFIFIKESQVENITKHVRTILLETMPKYSIDTHDAVILSPMNRGGAGTHCLNQFVQELLNPESPIQVKHHGTIYRIGDRVMQIRNNYDKIVFNGDCGTIETISLEDQILSVNFGERMIEYDFNELNELVLAYAITVHKSQGSEYRAVIIPVFLQHFTLLQKNLLYTALTRARSLCVLIGDPKAIAIALRNNKSSQRTTFLQSFLKESDLSQS